MDRRWAIEIMSGRRRGAVPALLRGAGWVLSKPYAGLLWLRRRLYRLGLLGAYKPAVPVISIGNITTGGTGKTPMVVWVVRWLKSAGLQPAILTRGYKAVDGRADEAEMLWQATGVPVVAEADRVDAARSAVAGGAEVLVLDDGFQHLRLRRDLDIVLIDATNPFGFGHCLPRGLLREPVSALGDADAVDLRRTRIPHPPATVHELTDRTAAEKRAATLAGLGITGVLYNGRHFRLSYPEEWERINAYARLVAEVCHAHGIKVIEHHDFTVFAYDSYPLMLAHLDWLQRDLRTGEIHRWACPHRKADSSIAITSAYFW